MARPYDEYKDPPLRRTLAEAEAKLEARREIAIATAPSYVIGDLCQRLAASALTAPKAVTYDP
ncbi:hypothetical protein J421_5812 (plasmid) [Gemmatirosa kalamazoonensis]|uniref:Uncharacterized protein n=1 Tax=Gemmatirosa kalamazoonensis TaxID=861299 RepID=W0RSA9_9BACT|nr:hypothetical protein [Gemmatirosa kalamazoonensis]AHG93347.1 hypothetical protein J421_5812 [Gemmatirosa kalamazoonensis]